MRITFSKKLLELVNLRPGVCVYTMSEMEMPNNDNKNLGLQQMT